MFAIKPGVLFAIYVVLDILCIGVGMGVPIFCILFGFVVGWFLVGVITTQESDLRRVLEKALRYAALTAGVTLVGMAIIWGPMIGYLFDPTRDLANFGIPMILYEPVASFIGWMALMIVISPFLQLLTTLFAANLALLRKF